MLFTNAEPPAECSLRGEMGGQRQQCNWKAFPLLLASHPRPLLSPLSATASYKCHPIQGKSARSPIVFRLSSLLDARTYCANLTDQHGFIVCIGSSGNLALYKVDSVLSRPCLLCQGPFGGL